MISGKRHCCWVFPNIFFGAVSTTFKAPFSPITLEKRQKSLWPISPKLGNLHQNYLDWYIALNVRGKICIYDFEVNCPFNTIIELHRHQGHRFSDEHFSTMDSDSHPRVQYLGSWFCDIIENIQIKKNIFKSSWIILKENGSRFTKLPWLNRNFLYKYQLLSLSTVEWNWYLK